jgi:hypothetical protein
MDFVNNWYALSAAVLWGPDQKKKKGLNGMWPGRDSNRRAHEHKPNIYLLWGVLLPRWISDREIGRICNITEVNEISLQNVCQKLKERSTEELQA